MDTTQPGFEDEFQTTATVWLRLWKAAEAGCFAVQKYFDDRDIEVNPSLAAEIQRFEAKRFLEEHGIHAQDDISLDPLTRNGIGFTYLGRHWRIWKIGSGRELVPRAGTSEKKLNFLNHNEEGYQFPMTLFPSEKNAQRLEEPSRVVLYQVDGQHNLLRLWFGIPRIAKPDAPTIMRWLEPVSFAMITALHVPQIEEIEPEQTDDLPYEMPTEPGEEEEQKAE